MRGWKYESWRHSMAAKGIRTSFVKTGYVRDPESVRKMIETRMANKRARENAKAIEDQRQAEIDAVTESRFSDLAGRAEGLKTLGGKPYSKLEKFNNKYNLDYYEDGVHGTHYFDDLSQVKAKIEEMEKSPPSDFSEYEKKSVVQNYLDAKDSLEHSKKLAEQDWGWENELYLAEVGFEKAKSRLEDLRSQHPDFVDTALAGEDSNLQTVLHNGVLKKAGIRHLNMAVKR